jgi:uncharacterized protein YfiM (DUF2279 family)
MPDAPSSPILSQGNAHLAFAKPTQKRRWRLKLFLFALALLVALSVSRSPSVPETPTPTSADVRSARMTFDHISQVGAQPGFRPVFVSWKQSQTAVQLAARAGGLRRLRVERLGGTAHVEGSIKLGLGFWANVHLFVEPDAGGKARVSGRIGRVPIPSVLAHGAIGVARLILKLRGAKVPPLDAMIAGLKLSDQGINAKLNLPTQTKLFAALGGLQPGGIDQERVALTYCRLVKEQKEAPSLDFAEHVRRGFAGGDGSVADNRSRFVALGMLTASPKLGQLAGGTQALVARCGIAESNALLLGRPDLAKHWAVSAALTAAFGEDASIAVGTWKEISDSGQGGSGFSLVDLSADRAGIFAAKHASDEAGAAAEQKRLATAQEADILPISAIAEKEGMSEAEFQGRYASTDSALYAATIRRIDGALAGVR